ncbi:hypothetical protein KUTeg_003905 [Tegillarca granosa]|uniref:Transposase Helix-turn-helix domain-containing protein n=1 Tax=Tegillarca granosa TaxID=220873 RepID=A0ABQ9FNC9_TEGGR|nr:hypothetical protein KUTeg_003905 [Tegillarca granosa]
MYIKDEWLMEENDVIGPDHTYALSEYSPVQVITTEKSTQSVATEVADKAVQCKHSLKSEYVQTDSYINKYYVSIDNIKLKQCQHLVQSISNENKKLKNKLKTTSPKFTAKSMLTDNSKVQFWVGLPNLETFTSLLNYLTPKANHLQYARGNENHRYLMHRKPGKQRKLSIEDEFFATLVRLKVGLFVTDIAQRLQISESYFSKLFTTWVRFLRLELESLTDSLIWFNEGG